MALKKMPCYCKISTYTISYWGERSETLLSDERCNSVCVCVTGVIVACYMEIKFVTGSGTCLT